MKARIEEIRNHNKRILLKRLIETVNGICEKKHLKYIAMDKLLNLSSDGDYDDNNVFDYRIALIGKDYYELVDSLDAEYRKKKNGILFNIASYFEGTDRYPTLSCSHSFPEEVGSKDIKVSLSVEQLSYIPEDEGERNQYYDAIEKASCKKHKKITFHNRVVFPLLKGKKTKGQTNNYSEILREQSKLLCKYKDTAFLGKTEQGFGNLLFSEDIFPIRRRDFMETYLMIPDKADKFMNFDIREREKNRFAVHQKTLERFHIFTKENGITYFAVKDLLIYVTSDGEFPRGKEVTWSLGLLREDYDRAISLLNSSKGSGDIALIETRQEHPTFKDKIKRIISKEDQPLAQGDHLYTIELLPYDRLPGNYREGFLFKDEVRGQLKACDRSFLRKTGKSVRVERSLEHNLKILESVITRYRNVKDAGKVFQAVTETNKNIPLNELLPTQVKTWKGTKISLPYNPYLWADEKDPGYTEYLAEGKTKVLKILDSICKEQNIPYFATADLLIGAYVYHDVIPCGGNGSFSIGFLRKDYERFLSFLRNHGREYGVQLNESRDPEGRYPMLTKHVTMTGRGDWLMMIRLHPYDKVPASFYTRKAFLDRIKVMNQEYEDALNFNLHTIGKYRDVLSQKELKRQIDKYAHADLVKMAETIEGYAQKYNEDPEPAGYQRIAFAFSGKLAVADSISRKSVLPFRDMNLVCLGDITPWYQPMDEELSYQIKTLQRENLKLLSEFHRVCRQMGIGYFICAGTLLGYLRHGGFIPWDDDVDVGMLREDYDKLLREGAKYFSEDYFLQTRESDPNIPYLYSKLRLNNTEYITEYTQDRDFHKGIGIDIFPFDYVPNDLKVRNKLIKEVTNLSLEHNEIARNQYPDKKVPFPPRNEEEQEIEDHEKAMIADYWKMSLKDSQQRYLDKATQYNALARKKNLKTVASFVISYTCINIEDLLPYQTGLFEGIEVLLPKYPHALMSMQYGNYMEPPLLHKQVSHKVVKWAVGEDGSEKMKEHQKQ